MKALIGHLIYGSVIAAWLLYCPFIWVIALVSCMREVDQWVNWDGPKYGFFTLEGLKPVDRFCDVCQVAGLPTVLLYCGLYGGG